MTRLPPESAWGPDFDGHVAVKFTPGAWGPDFDGHVAVKVTPGSSALALAEV